MLLVMTLLLSSSVQGYAQSKLSVINYEPSQGVVNIGTLSLAYLDDGNLSATQIIDANILTRFTPYTRPIPNFASTPNNVWMMFSICNRSSEKLYLHVGSAFMDHIELHRVRGSQFNWSEAEPVQFSGDDYQFAQREIDISTFLFSLRIPRDSTYTYLLRVRSLQPLFFPLQVGTLDHFIVNNHLLDFVQGLYFGVMLLIGLYNFFLFLGTRDVVYLFYIAYLLCITLFMSLISMYAFEFFWPTYPIINKYAVASAALTMFASVLFTQAFLQTRKQAPLLHKLSYVFIVIAAVDIVLVFSPLKILGLQVAQAGIMGMSVFLASTGVVIYRRGYHPARFYLLAWSFLIIALVFMILESLNITPVLPFINPGQIGSAFEATLLSFALADRINIYKRQREEAQLRLLKELESKADLIARQNELLAIKVDERTIELRSANAQLEETLSLVEREKKVSEELLLNILPAEVAEELKVKGHAEARLYGHVTVLFTDFVNFTGLAETMTPEELVAELNRSISAFDHIIENRGLEKIKTIGDAYLAAAGLPAEDPRHAFNAVLAALDIIRWQTDPANSSRFLIRVGLHSGPVVAGIVGVKKYAYDIWGDTVNVAARMEQHCEPGRVNVSHDTYSLIKNEFQCDPRGEIEVKHKGLIRMYYVN
ncbi:MAG: hypothetical protein HYX66_04375 [Ignavibacteria bacterium]|nr:hypothetical protein [Ignavibacteria bacterium]